MRRQQHMQPIIGKMVLHCGELDALQNCVSLRISHDLLFDAVSAGEARIDQSECWDALSQPMNLRLGVALFLGEEIRSVRDYQSHVADARLIDTGIKYFVENSMAQREPDKALVAEGSAHARFCAASPTWRNTREHGAFS